MKMPNAQTGTYQQSLNRVIMSHRTILKNTGPGKEAPNQRVKLARKLLRRNHMPVTASKAQNLLILHSLMAWTDQEIKHLAALRRERQAIKKAGGTK